MCLVSECLLCCTNISGMVGLHLCGRVYKYFLKNINGPSAILKLYL